jgi:hypothetical protein
MLALPPAPPAIGWTNRIRLPRDYYVRIASNDYSVDPTVVGRFVEVVADLTHVTITCAGTVVGHHRRCWAKHQTLTDPAHRETGFRLAHQGAATAQAAHLGVGDAGHVVVERRDLSVYDAVFGTTSNGETSGGADGEVA